MNHKPFPKNSETLPISEDAKAVIMFSDMVNRHPTFAKMIAFYVDDVLKWVHKDYRVVKSKPRKKAKRK